MCRIREGRGAASSWAAFALLAVASSSSSLVYAQSNAAHPAKSPPALMDQYCVFCHNEKTKTGGVVLSGLDPNNVAGKEDLFERVLRKVRAGEMPPPNMPRPTPEVSAAFTKTLEESLDRAGAAKPNAGRPAVHRLNRAEYSNAIRDVLALDIHPGDQLPVDDTGYGFDNIGDVLSVSPILLERYMSVSRMVSRLAVGDTQIKPVVEEFAAHRDAPGSAAKERNERASDDLPFDSRGGFSFQYYFPVDAEYTIRVKANQGPGGGDKAPLEVKMPVKAGLRTIGISFLRESAKPEVAIPGGGRRPGGGGGAPGAGRGPTSMAELDLRLDGAKVKRFEIPEGANPPQVNGATISGPYNITGAGDTPSRARIFVCKPAGEKEEAPCARTILSTVARRAFRRPVTDADLKPLMAFYQSGRTERNFEFGIQKALRAMLVSPDFLFRVETDPKGTAPGSNYRLSDVELASRLSFFVWSSVPDDQLLDLAEKGKLKDPVVLEAQVKRMLADPRSSSLVSNFAGQWLFIRGLAQQKPDPDAFPEFDESLRQAFQHETELFFQSILREDRSILELLDANYTFLNQRLAEHYGISNIYGSQFRKVDLTDPNRGGLLGQGSLLTVTSYPNRTSVVQRGKWVLDNLLGSPPPPPPAVIPELVAHAKDGKPLTMRQQMEMHRADPVCASCHARMDPIGFALENYDGVGKWRDEDSGNKIDATGKLPGNVTFEKPAGLKKLLATNYRDQYESTVTEKFLTYALGRGLEYYDKPAVRAIMREAGKDNYRMSALIMAVVKSTPFEMRRSPEP